MALFDEADIPWGELAFPVVELALHHFLNDRQSGEFIVRHEEIRRPWKSPRSYLSSLLTYIRNAAGMPDSSPQR